MKEFKVAHIVPVCHLEDTKDNQYHMCLAHLVSCQEYKKFYAKMADEGKYVLMDNGAAEGNQLRPEQLLVMYKQINPTEIVLPDTLFDASSTIQKSRNFMSLLAERGLIGRYNLMAVPQGNNLDEWTAAARVFVKDTRIHSIGVSKFLNTAIPDNFCIRFIACAILKDLIVEYERYDLEVHLLGCDDSPLVINMCQIAFPFVRGCDSAYSYIASQAHKILTLEDCRRPKGTINFLDGRYEHLLRTNMVQFNKLAGVKEDNNGVDGTWE